MQGKCDGDDVGEEGKHVKFQATKVEESNLQSAVENILSVKRPEDNDSDNATRKKRK